MSLRSIGRAIVTFAIAALIMVTSFRRSRLGVSGPHGRVDVRRPARPHLQAGQPAAAAAGWLVESALKSAGGTPFAGDFFVARRSRRRPARARRGRRLRQGRRGGSRSLFLSGAFNGIVSALPASGSSRRQRLPAGPGLGRGLRHRDPPHLDLRTGDFEVRKAGHPPAVWLHAGLGPLAVLEADGPGPGTAPRRRLRRRPGSAAPGDALLLFTDGLVETAERDISLGIDKLPGRGSGCCSAGSTAAPSTLIDTMEQTNDDRALVVLHRR